MPRPKTKLNHKEVCEIIDACKNINVSRIRYLGLELDFFAKDNYSHTEEQEETNTFPVAMTLQDQEASEQHDKLMNQASVEHELDMLRVTDPVAYDAALQKGLVNDEGYS